MGQAQQSFGTAATSEADEIRYLYYSRQKAEPDSDLAFFNKHGITQRDGGVYSIPDEKGGKQEVVITENTSLPPDAARRRNADEILVWSGKASDLEHLRRAHAVDIQRMDARIAALEQNSARNKLLSERGLRP